MKRKDMMKAQLTDEGWRLDPHSATYQALSRRQFSISHYTVSSSEAHRPDLVSLACYGRVDWWLVICLFNGIINPIKEMEMGRQLQIPDFAEVNRLLKSDDNRSKVGQVVEV